MTMRLDYSGYDPARVIRTIEMNRQASLGEWTICPICGQGMVKTAKAKFMCGKIKCNNVLRGLRKFGYLPKKEKK
jgi:hypothetical protein